MPSTKLSAREKDVLSFERDWHLHGGHKQQAIRDHFGFAPSYYYQLLAAVLQRPEAEAFDPLLVKRLRRQRDARRQRAGRGLSEQVSPAGGRPVNE